MIGDLICFGLLILFIMGLVWVASGSLERRVSFIDFWNMILNKK